MDRRLSIDSDDSKYKHIGQELDGQSGFNYFGARYCDAKTGRWLGPDWLEEYYPDLTPYCYSRDNPIVYVDPDGESYVRYDIVN